MSRILLVDDDVHILRFYRGILVAEGHQTQTASNGAEALGFWEQEDNNFDMAITDFDMPGMKGDELSVRMKIEKPNCPIIMITGSLEPPYHKADVVLAKPISPQKLLETVSLFLKR